MYKTRINPKTISRIAAIQAIYQYEIQDIDKKNLDLAIKNILKFYNDPELYNDLEISNENNLKLKLNLKFFQEITLNTIEDITEIDKIIIDNVQSKSNTKTEINILCQALMRVAICELKFFPLTPIKVVLNEFTNIASSMLIKTEIGFVNSVLNSIALSIKKS